MCSCKYFLRKGKVRLWLTRPDLGDEAEVELFLEAKLGLGEEISFFNLQ